VQSYLTDAVAYLPVLGIAVMVLIFFGFVGSFIDRLLPSFQRMGLSQMAGGLLVRLLRAFLWLIGVVLTLDILGVTALVGAVLGTAGLMGIAIGFAFQDIIENYLAGLILSVRHPFNLNDHVKMGAEEGKVIRLTSRELVLMTLDGNHVRIPNAVVFKSTIYNYTRNPRRRFNFDTGIDVEEDLQRVQRIGGDTLRSMESVMGEPGPFSLVHELGDFNVIVTFYGWVDQSRADFAKVRSEAIRLVKNALDDAGVLMPEPIYNVRMQTVSKNLVEEARDRKKKTALDPDFQKEGDVAVEKDIEEQIEEDLRISDEPNLLTDDPAR
jgi:small-conductance mechanosensitive channel